MSLHRAAFRQGLARVQRAYERLVTLSPIFKYDALMVLDDEADTMGFHEDGTLRINNEYFMDLTDDEAAFGLATLILMMRAGLADPKRRGEREHYRWMIAGHHCYNNIVFGMKNVGVPTKGTVLNLTFADMTVEEIYDYDGDIAGFGMTVGKMQDGSLVIPGPGVNAAEMIIRAQLDTPFAL